MLWAEKGLRLWLLVGLCIACVGYMGWIYRGRVEAFQTATASGSSPTATTAAPTSGASPTSKEPVPNQLGAVTPSTRITACSELHSLRGQIASLVASMKRSMNDISGLPLTQRVAIAAKSENMVFQYRHTDACTALINLANPTGLQLEQQQACIRIASQDQQLYNTIIPAYDLTNSTLYEQEDAINETLYTINDTITLLKCRGPADISGDITFSVDDDVGTIDNDELKETLNILSPYYISGATLAYITTYLVGNGLLDSALYSSTDIFKNVWGTTQGIQDTAAKVLR